MSKDTGDSPLNLSVAIVPQTLKKQQKYAKVEDGLSNVDRLEFCVVCVYVCVCVTVHFVVQEKEIRGGIIPNF